jgi:alkanesulfonate monooxygenase SsuD/methylene tetrahydromethanopterin reductase-like flavin-dependent oxidoreductase (luciferase family)
MSPEKARVVEDHVQAGLAESGVRKRADFDLAPFVTCIVGDDLDKCRGPVRGMLALYIGGMGARGKNFYNDLACRYGFEEAAKKIQDLYLDGKKAEATAAVPDELADEVSLVGPKERIRDRLAAWRESPVTTMICGFGQPEALRLMAELQ